MKQNFYKVIIISSMLLGQIGFAEEPKPAVPTDCPTADAIKNSIQNLNLAEHAFPVPGRINQYVFTFTDAFNTPFMWDFGMKMEGNSADAFKSTKDQIKNFLVSYPGNTPLPKDLGGKKILGCGYYLSNSADPNDCRILALYPLK